MTIDTEHPTLVEKVVIQRKDDFDRLLERAAEQGALRAMAHLGVENGHAAKDFREVRDLLDSWHITRRTAWQTVIKVVTTGLIAALLLGAGIKLKLMGGGA